eukprot:SAG11_NODE_15696_length_569_cov_0.814894_1_plen_93_part_01
MILSQRSSHEALVALMLMPSCAAGPPTRPLEMVLAVTVDPTNITDHVSQHMYGSGIETYSHCMYGGFWSNMLWDDSVEEAGIGPLTKDNGRAW